MTANTMANELELALDRSDSFGSPGYEDFELTSVLTEAQESYIKRFISQLNNRKQQGFQETEVRNQGLSALIRKGATLPVSAVQTDVLSNGVFYDLPTDFMYTIYEEATINQNVCNTTTPIVADVRVVSYNEVRRLIKNVYKKPYFKDYGEALVWRTEYSREVSGQVPANPATKKRHQLLTDGSFNITNYTIVYLKNPPAIVVDRTTVANQRNSELDESTHWVIINIATDLMLQRVKEQKIQNIESMKDLE